MGAVLQLAGYIGVADDGPGDELGKHGHIRAEVHQRALGQSVAPVNVDGVAEDLEGVKADADGQGHMGQGKIQAQGVQGVHREIRVLEPAQKA